MRMNTYAEPALDRENPPLCDAKRSSRPAANTTLEFGRFCLLVHQRQLVADGVPINLGTRAFDLLLVLLEADGSLVTKDELLNRVWPGIVVADENLHKPTHLTNSDENPTKTWGSTLNSNKNWGRILTGSAAEGGPLAKSRNQGKA